MKYKVGVLSAGAWGTAVAKVVAENGHDVTMWDFMEDVVDDINNNHLNTRFLNGIRLPETLKATINIEEAANCDFLIIATPSKFIVNIVKQILAVPTIQEGTAKIGILTKGFLDIGNGPDLITNILQNYLPGFYNDNIVYISGPSHAEEVARKKITGLVCASKNGRNSVAFKNLINNSFMKVFSSLDVEGVQVCAAMKNVIAIAYGMIDALGEFYDVFGDNSESLLLAAGLYEINQLGTAMGSKYPETFASIAGVGDLDVTCKSKYGRNRKFGRSVVTSNCLHSFNDIEDLLENILKIGYLPEGAYAAYNAQKLTEKYGLKLPITAAVYKILNKEIQPIDAITDVLI